MDQEFAVGSSIGKYIVQGKLGKGGFGTVYKVLNSFTEEVSALKLFSAEVPVQDVLREYRIMRALSHDHIARVETAEPLDGDHAFIVSEYVGDENLVQYTRAESLLPLRDVRRIGEQVLAALCYMHQNRERLEELLEKGTINTEEYNEYKQRSKWGFYHRDIKPANIVISSGADELWVKLVDFNASVSLQVEATPIGRSIPYYPADGDELELQAERGGDAYHMTNANLDLFATGIALYELTVGHHPYERLAGSGGTTRKPDFEGQTPASNWQSRLPGSWVEFFAKACAPLASERFATAQAMLAALRTLPEELNPPATNQAAVSVISISAEEMLRPNYNPYVTRFLTMYSQARGGNRGTRSGPSQHADSDTRQDELTAATYVPTRLDTELLEDILSGRYRLVVITGNAGDGKTAFIRKLEATSQQLGSQIDDDGGNGSRFVHNGYTFHTNYDGSQDEQGQPNSAVLRRFFSLFADNANNAWSTLLADGKVFVIAINEGRLRDFLSREQEQGEAHFSGLQRLVEYFFSGSVELPSDVAFINLNTRSLVAEDEAKESSSIFDRQLAALLDDSFWQPCESCELRERCYIKFNADSLRDAGVGLQARERAHRLLDVTHLRRKLHMTMRDLRSLLAYLICADTTCDEVATKLAQLTDPDSGKLVDKLLDYASGFYYNLAERVSSDRVVEQISEIDVAKVANPVVDRNLYFEGIPGGSGELEFTTRSNVDRDIYAKVRELLTELPDQSCSQRFHRQLRRRAYFERKSAEVSEMLPYHYFEQFQDTLNSDPSSKVAESRLTMLRQLLRGLSLATGEDNGKVGLPDDDALYLRAVVGKSRPSIFSYRRFAASEFTLHPQQLDENQSQYVEHRPDRLLLKHHSESNTSDATLEVSLDLFESLMQSNDGYIPSRDEVQGSLINLSIFRNTLARLPYRELLLLDGARRYLITEDGRKLIFSRMEEE